MDDMETEIEHIHDEKLGGTSRAKPGLRLWLRLLTIRNLIHKQFQSRLSKRWQTNLSRMDFARILLEHPDGLKMSDVSRLMMISKGSVTAISDNLELAGVIVRERSARDRRSHFVRLTPSGRSEVLHRLAIQDGWLEGMFSGLTKRELEQLDRLLEKLKESVNAAVGQK